MIRKLGIILMTALAGTYPTAASAAERDMADVSSAKAIASASNKSADASTADFGAEVRDPSVTVANVTHASLVAAQSGGSERNWEFAITPYLWASGTKADIDTPQGEEFNVDKSFGDILDDLKFAFMGSFEVTHGRFVSVQDIMYLSLGSSAKGHFGPIPLRADADTKLLSTTHLFGYRVVDKGPMFVDLFAGGRITSIKVDLEVTALQQTLHRDTKETQFGPVIGSRFRAPLGGNWGLGLYGDIGGFGVGADLSWQLLGTIQYDLSERWRLLAGWRHFSAEQSKGDFDVHMRLDGPILGVSYRF